MARKVILIGIDGMDSCLVNKFINDMTNFRYIKSHSPDFRFKSIFPPDSTPAWASVYTGLNPANHGIINFINPADKYGKVVMNKFEDSNFKGRTFWDLAGKSGKRSCIVLPFNIFPGWEINGSIICRINTVASKDYPLSAYPLDLLEKYSPSSLDLNMLQEYFSLKHFPRLIEMCRRRTYAECDLACKMLKEERWDLFFIYFSALDGIQHFFWSFYDESHPHYTPDNPYKDVIREFYLLIDGAVGELIASLKEDVSIIIMSDHGHGMRPTVLFNINEVLRRHGFLYPSSSKSKKVNPLYKTKWLKKQLVSYVNRFGIGSIGLKIAHRFPIWKRLLASPLAIDWSKTRAYVTDLSAIKSYNYGGIRINKDIVPEGQQGKIINDIIDILLEVKDPKTNKRIVKWACRREELYSGYFIERYPEIVLELDDTYGLGWEINCPLFESGFTHNIQPGSHKRDTPVLYTINMDVDASREIALMDFAPTILRCIGIYQDSEFDGLSFLV